MRAHVLTVIVGNGNVRHMWDGATGDTVCGWRLSNSHPVETASPREVGCDTCYGIAVGSITGEGKARARSMAAHPAGKGRPVKITADRSRYALTLPMTGWSREGNVYVDGITGETIFSCDTLDVPGSIPEWVLDDEDSRDEYRRKYLGL